MCLATVLILGEEKQVIGKYVSHLRVDGDSLEFEDVSGNKKTVKANIVDINLVDNVISVRPCAG